MPVRPSRVVVGAEAPDFELAGSSGDIVRLARYGGRAAVLLVFLRGFG
jgi:peroxiredoxin